MKQFNLDYFIDFYSTIPEKHFTLTSDAAGLDVYGWLDVEEANALWNIVKRYGLLREVNDGSSHYRVFGSTIKERVINFLVYIKDKQI